MPAPDNDPLRSLFPGLTPRQREVVLQMQARADEIQQWFSADPKRVQALQAQPYETIARLSEFLEITLPSALPENMPTITILLNPLDCVCPPPPNSLISAVWQYIGQSPANLSAWDSNPTAVITQVAAATGASNQDRDCLINAFELVFGTAPVVNLTATIQRLRGVSPDTSKLMIR